MGIKNRRNLRVLDGDKVSATNKIDRFKERIKQIGLTDDEKKKEMLRILLITGGVLVIAVVIFLVISLRTYTGVKVSDTYSVAGAADSSYEEFANGVLKYTRDGIAYLNMDGEEQWNLPYQIKTPFVEVNEKAAAVADKGGNDIMVFDERGLRGEIKTTLPIEKMTVSNQGIVGVILKNESSPRIICYDVAGNILVEHKISLAGMGYPMDVAISENGEILQVSYMHVHSGKLISKVVYYNFGESKEDIKDHQAGYKEFENTVLAAGFYMDDNVSAVVGDNCMTIFKGTEKVKEVATIAFDNKVQSIAYSDKYIAVVMSSPGQSGYELCMYNKSGKLVTNEIFNGEYRNIKIEGRQVIMYDGKECAIFLKNGIKKFDGEMNNSIFEIVTAAGVNKYIVMNANGMESVRLVE